MENARFSKHDAKWISLMWENENPPEEWLRAYWNGDPCSIGPDNSIWELISESASVVWTRDLRERAYEEIKRYDEKCLGMLELARVAAELGYNLGHIQLFLKIKGSMLETSYIMNSAFDDPEFLKDFADYKGPKNTDDLNATALLTTPNLNWGNQALEIDPPVYQIMHAIMGN
jgi:hypothetical protein